MAFILYPAIDISVGRVVRPRGAEISDVDASLADPVVVARGFAALGARWVHLVDLDRAFGRGSNALLIAEVVETLHSYRVQVQLSAGIHDPQSLAEAMETAADRLVLSAAALADLGFATAAIGQGQGRLVPAIDVGERYRVTPRGTDLVLGDAFDAITELEAAGAARFIVTDVARDGALTGPNLALLRLLRDVTFRPLIVSGGIASLQDIHALAGTPRVAGAIVGKALYTGQFTLAEALTAIDRL